MKVSIENFGGTLIKSNEKYDLFDHNYLPNLTLSKTRLNPSQCTTGHKHDGLDEVYMFVKGNGFIEIDDKTTSVKGGDIVQIKGGEFHKVYNNSSTDNFEFISIFQSYER